MAQEKRLEYIMYGFTLRSLSDIQKGIQHGHAVSEFGLKYPNDQRFKDWQQFDKTVRILNGGTSNRTGKNEYNDKIEIGNMEQICELFTTFKIPYAAFYEPALNNATTAIAFLVDERVFDLEKYPPYSEVEFFKNSYRDWANNIGGAGNAMLRNYLPTFKSA